eukprot:11035171-Alexandrium_andersonii.AAC.1
MQTHKTHETQLAQAVPEHTHKPTVTHPAYADCRSSAQHAQGSTPPKARAGRGEQRRGEPGRARVRRVVQQQPPGNSNG